MLMAWLLALKCLYILKILGYAIGKPHKITGITFL